MSTLQFYASNSFSTGCKGCHAMSEIIRRENGGKTQYTVVSLRGDMGFSVVLPDFHHDYFYHT
jgi:hypothetical protein